VLSHETNTEEGMPIKLWRPDDLGSIRASVGENMRVRELYAAEKAKHLDPAEHPLACKCKACGKYRGDFARGLVQTCERNGLHVPGQDVRRPLREGQTSEMRRVDAARTNVRQFEDGTRGQPEWMLCGVEATIAERNGMALPPCAYQTQGMLVDA
jgi:hypothetical protein